MQKVQLIDVESSKRNAALPLHLACRGKLTVLLVIILLLSNLLHLACRGKLTESFIHKFRMLVQLHLACRGKLTDYVVVLLVAAL